MATRSSGSATRLAYGRGRRRPEPWAEIAALWKRALELGQPRAHLHLARLYLRGKGVRKNGRRAYIHYACAGLEGFTAAQWELGWALLEGDGMSADPEDAANWFAIGAASGDPACMNQIGDMLHEGVGRRRNRPQAVWFYRRAAERGHGRAMFRLARCYDLGHGVACSPRWSQHWMRRAADAGDALARRWLRASTAAQSERVQTEAQTWAATSSAWP